MIDISIDMLESLMTLASGTSYQYGRDGRFKDDDIDNSKFHADEKERIKGLINAAMVKEVKACKYCPYCGSYNGGE